MTSFQDSEDPDLIAQIEKYDKEIREGRNAAFFVQPDRSEEVGHKMAILDISVIFWTTYPNGEEYFFVFGSNTALEEIKDSIREIEIDHSFSLA